MKGTCLLSVFACIAAAAAPEAVQAAGACDLNTELISAIKARDAHRVTTLLQDGADPNASEPVYVPLANHELPPGLPEANLTRLALLTAVNGAEPIRRLISPDGTIETTDRGAQSRDAELLELPIVKALVTKGADVNATGCMGRTPFMWALRDGHTKTAQFLMAHGADAKIRDDE
jgi:ankyrin repeat protein